ncbi:methyl-accepting chemotaxis protein [Rhodospirillum sp. A1_3_36]|uniref:methyl-accepting chemotaxis protein n=1 Tax=Rhodospirillum sp. A1_3_36 TaxID=3391666 RepID=UPI0039A40B35
MKWSSLKTKPKILLGIALPTVLMVFLGILSLSSIGKIVDTANWVDHTNIVIGQANTVVASAVDMETGMRGFLLTGKDDFLAPYVQGQKTFKTQIADLKATVSDNPQQVSRLTEAEGVLNDWRKTVAEEAIALRRKVGDTTTMNDISSLVGQSKGKAFMDKFRGIMTDFVSEEAGLMKIRKQQNLDTESTTSSLIIGGIVAALILGGGCGVLIGDSIAKPIEAMTAVMGRLASGDKSAEIPGVDRADEVGKMAAAVVVFKDSMLKTEQMAHKEAEEARVHAVRAKQIETLTQDFDVSVSQLLKAVSQSANGMQHTATSMSKIADDTKHRATSVATAAEQASANVETVAAATEELASSIQEISRQVAQSSTVSHRAVDEADQTDRQVQGLAESATRIGEVINLISDIADQTNLLALNATIEAARAGDAGKGFAVVASEVKSLANQTGKATEDISNQITAIQAETEKAVAAIKSIGSTINESNTIASAIASAVEEQQAATQEIARNVEQASSGTRAVTSNILEVTRAAGESDGAAEDVNAAAMEVNEKAGDLRSRIEAFLKEVRSA